MAVELLVGVILLSFIAAIHWLLWKRLVKDLSRRSSARIVLGTASVIVSLLLSTAAILFGPDSAQIWPTNVLTQANRVWLAFLIYLAAALVVAELARLVLRRVFRKKATQVEPRIHTGGVSGNGDRNRSPTDQKNGEGEQTSNASTRRAFIDRTVTTGAGVLAVALYLYDDSHEKDDAMAAKRDPELRPVEVSLPFTGRWKVENSPKRRVPSHGTDMLGTTYSIDFVGVDDHDRTAPSVSWRTVFSTEPPELFFAFGRPILAPVSGRVVAVHQGEVDHGARRSQLTLVPYALGQAARLRQGVGAIAGNYVIISSPGSGVFVGVMHLQADSILVSVGQDVGEGEHIANCGNTGNSTQPHVHMQAMNSADPWTARGLPMHFKRFGEKAVRGQRFVIQEDAIPDEASIVEALR
ncbi:MAG: M23 family metallopeptidase [Actinomycetota bacterium]|nr:M23 family metallopeptidase [Actinomycetota bacterium]